MKNEEHFEEKFEKQKRVEEKTHKKILKRKDRSKFKKTDLEKFKEKEKREIKTTGEVFDGLVTSIEAEGVTVDFKGSKFTCFPRGTFKQKADQTKNFLAVGDNVVFQTINEKEGSIIKVLPRKSILARASNLSRTKEQLIAANIDQVLITCSVVTPPLKPPLIDRYIIACKKGNMEPIIVINKIDLLQNDADEATLYNQVLTTYTDLGIKVFPVSTITGQGLEALREAMKDKCSVFSGQSGTGKSSIMNAIFETEFETGELAQKTLKGSHTTTNPKLIHLEGGGFCIDTPGIRSFGLWQIQKKDLQNYFSEIFEAARNCKYPNCTHTQEPRCAVKIAVEEKIISHLRFSSYQSLMEELSEEHRKR